MDRNASTFIKPWLEEPPVATTYALKWALASWMAKWPTPPAPPWISMRAPGLGAPPDSSACERSKAVSSLRSDQALLHRPCPEATGLYMGLPSTGTQETGHCSTERH